MPCGTSAVSAPVKSTPFAALSRLALSDVARTDRDRNAGGLATCGDGG